MARVKKVDPIKEAIVRMRAAADNPTLDEIWNRQPSLHTVESRMSLIEAKRMQRAAWKLEQQAKAERKAERLAKAGMVPEPDLPGEEDEW